MIAIAHGIFVKIPEEIADGMSRMLDTVTQMLDSGRTRVVAYLVAAALSLVWYRRERRAIERAGLGGHAPTDWWPTYWLLTALVLATMGVGRAGALGDAFAELGREQARSSGWYERRRGVQVAAVVTVTIGWVIGVLVAIWRVPPRRRRYLPNVVAISSVAAFAAVRLISLHHIDTVLYRRDLGGIRIVAIAELFLLAMAAATILVVRRFQITGTAAISTSEPNGYSASNPRSPSDERVGHTDEEPS